MPILIQILICRLVLLAYLSSFSAANANTSTNTHANTSTNTNANANTNPSPRPLRLPLLVLDLFDEVLDLPNELLLTSLGHRVHLYTWD